MNLQQEQYKNKGTRILFKEVCRHGPHPTRIKLRCGSTVWNFLLLVSHTKKDQRSNPKLSYYYTDYEKTRQVSTVFHYLTYWLRKPPKPQPR